MTVVEAVEEKARSLEPSEPILLEAIALLEKRISLFEGDTDPVVCVAEGRIATALETLKEAANLLGED